MVELIHKKLGESIIGAAMTVLNALKPGLDEKLYERTPWSSNSESADTG